MKISVCITVLNEEKSIAGLIESLVRQSQKPNEIIIVDGGSEDKAIEIINHYKKNYRNIKFIRKKCNRAKGRNISIALAKNEIIATTDADCVAKRDWLKNITNPFKNERTDIVAGFYEMRAENNLQKAMSFFLGVLPSQFDKTFLPSTRSMAFRKSFWKVIGGFPENKGNSAEDTDFNQKAIEFGARYAHAKNAKVVWNIPSDLKGFIKKIYNYSFWDAMYGTWWHKQKRFKTHNIKSLLKLVRYLIGLILLFLAIKNLSIRYLIILLILSYSYWSYRKVYLSFRSFKVSYMGFLLQVVTDAVVIISLIIALKKNMKQLIKWLLIII